jgi:hypothetical protein
MRTRQVWLLSRSALYAVAFALSTFSVVSAFADMAGLAVAFLVLSAITLVKLGRYENMFHMTWLTGHVVFCVVPSLICLATAFPIAFELAALCSALSVLALALTDRPSPAIRVSWTPSPSMFTLVVVLAAGVMVASQGASFLFSILLLILLFSVTARGQAMPVLIALYLLLVGFILLYAALFWGGFGRLVLAGTLIVPTLLTIRRLRIPFGKYIFLVFCAAGGVLGTLLRISTATFGSVLRASLGDSNVGPLVLGQSFIDRARNGVMTDWSGWFDQVILLGLAVWPRDWWREKPQGFGAAWVAENMGPGYLGHSIASTFIGEHIYYLGLGWGLAAAAAAVVVIAKAYNVLMSSRYLFGLGGYLVAVYLPTFYWGGMASFATRFWTGLVPLAIMLAIFVLLKRSVGTASGARHVRAVRPLSADDR